MKLLKPSFELAGMSIGMGMMGEAFGSEGLKEGGKVAGNFISPVVNISMGGMLINQLRDLSEGMKNVGKVQKKKKG